VARIDSLTRELNDVAKEFDAFTAKELQDANHSLTGKGLPTVQPETREMWDKSNDQTADSGGLPATYAFHLRP
jgi:hypothetical protein